MGFANNHKLHSLQSQTHSTSFRFIQSSFTQQAAGHPLPLLCSPALSFGLRAVMFFAQRVVGRHAASSFQQSAHPSKKSRQPLLGAFLFPPHMLSLQSLPHSSHRPPMVGLLAHTLPPARGLTSLLYVRPWRLAYPTKAFALPIYK